MPVRSVGQLIEGKALYSAKSDAVISDVCDELRSRNIGALAILDQGRLTGIISERDIVARVVAAGQDPRATSAAYVMTPNPVTVNTNASIIDALERMLEGGFRHLPVMEGEEPVGMISMRDIPLDNCFLYQRLIDVKQADPALQY